MKRLYLNCMFYTQLMILDIMFTFYCMKFYQRHYLLSKLFSPSQRCHGVCMTKSIYTLVLPIYVLFLCDFTCVVWLMGQLWPFCVNKMTTTTTQIRYKSKMSENMHCFINFRVTARLKAAWNHLLIKVELNFQHIPNMTSMTHAQTIP